MMHSNVIILVIVCGACLITDVQLMQCSINGALRRVHQFFFRDKQSNVSKTAEYFKLFNGVCERLTVAQNPPPKRFNIDQPATRDSPRGYSSEVVRVKFGVKTNRKAYAVKRISMSWIADESEDRGIVAFTEVCTEMKILQEVDHPFIVKLHWSLWNEKYAVMIFDYYQMDSLLELIASTSPLSEEKAKFYSAQLVLAIEYLHETKHIVHRDIKGENILVDNEGYLKVTDFGVSVFDDGKLVNDLAGTISYAAPEVLAAGDDRYGHPSKYLRKPTDIWSLGVVIFGMLFGKLPFVCDDIPSMLNLMRGIGVRLPEEHAYVKVGKNGFGKPALLGKPSEKLDTREMLQDMLKINPENRLTIKKIKDHDSWNTPSAWIKPGTNPPKFDWEALLTRKFRAPIQPSKDFKRYIDTESGYEFNKLVVKTRGA